MANSRQYLSEFFTLYQNQTSTTALDLPTDPDILLSLLEEIKPAIVNALYQGEKETAQQLASFAETIAQYTQDPEHHALSAWCNGLFYLNRSLSISIKYLNKARRFYADNQQDILEGRVLIGIAGQLCQIGHIDEAEQAILRARDCLLSQPEYRDWPTIYLNLAHIQFHQAKYEQMLASAKHSESLALSFTQRYPERHDYYRSYQTQAIINQALASLFLGQMKTAEARLKQAIEIAEAHQWPEIMGRAHLSLARICTLQGDLFAALEILQKAEDNFRNAHIDFEQATVALYQADIYGQLMMPIQARSSAVQAAKILTQSDIMAESVESYLLAVQISLSRREKKRAKRYLDVAKPQLPHVPPVLQALWDGYTAHPLLQKDDSMLQAALDQANAACLALKEMGAIKQWLTTSMITAGLVAENNISEAKVRYAEIIVESQTRHFSDVEQQACMQLALCQTPEESIVNLRRAADILVLKREQMPVEELKANLIGGSSSLYTQLIEAALTVENYSMATQGLIEAKGGIWSDLLAPSNPISMPLEWTQARAQLSYWREEMRSTTEPEYLKLCQHKIDQAEKAIADIARSQHRSRLTQPLPTQAQVQASLDTGQVILDYLVGSQCIWVCLISQDFVQWVELGPRASIERVMSRFNMLIQSLLYVALPNDASSSITETRQQVAANQLENIQRLLNELYVVLVEPLQSQLKQIQPTQLFLAPDNYLFELPWTALYDGQQYLGQCYELTLFPSAALLSNDQDSNKLNSPILQSEQTLDDVKLGPPLLLGYRGEPPLEYLDDSLTAIQKIWAGAQKINPAEIENLKWDKVPQWLHIGAHGHVNRKTPLFSQLDLADGPLLLADIFNLNLYGCDLVTLSACETGTTPEQGGVILALAGSFLCAGAKNVIATLWPVDDEATTRLMRAFYTAYQMGMAPQEALKLAQEELRGNGYEHPFYWAAFQIFTRSKKL